MARHEGQQFQDVAEVAGLPSDPQTAAEKIQELFHVPFTARIVHAGRLVREQGPAHFTGDRAAAALLSAVSQRFSNSPDTVFGKA